MYELVKLGKLELRLLAAHFNHGLRDGESDRDEQFVREFTAARRIEFAADRARPLTGGNLEQNARMARYEFLNDVADGVDAFAILTGATLAGAWLLRTLSISLPAFRIAGALLLFSIASEMAFGMRITRQSETAGKAVGNTCATSRRFRLRFR